MNEAYPIPLTIYGRHTSYNVQKVLWFLDELEVTYNHVELGSTPTDTETDEFGKLNPMRKVPVLVDGDSAIWESNTILRYLLGKYGHGKWVVDCPYQRSLHERWMDWAQTVLEPAFIGVFWGYYRTPVDLHNKEEIEKSIEACEKCLLQIDAQLSSQKYLAGQHISLADICVSVFIYRLVEIGLDIQLPENVNNWYDSLKLLPVQSIAFFWGRKGSGWHILFHGI